MDPERLKDRFFAVLSSILEIDARSLPLDASPDTVESWAILKERLAKIGNGTIPRQGS